MAKKKPSTATNKPAYPADKSGRTANAPKLQGTAKNAKSITTEGTENTEKAVQIPGQKQIKYLALILGCICIALYANTIPNGYVVDDGAAITQNKIVQQGIGGIPVLLKTGFLYGMYGLTSSKFSYRPVSLTSFAIEHSLWGDNPHISHAINVLLFMLTVVLLFYLLQKILPGRLRIMTAFVISALFAAHPIHTEVVGYIKSRDEIFSFLFLLLAMWFAIKYQGTGGTKGTGTMKNLIISAIFFFLALMSKESAITFVAIIPFTLFYFLKVKKGQIISTSLALVLAMAAYLALRISIFGDLIHSEEKFEIIDNFMQPMNFITRLPVAIAIIGKYILKLVFPQPLSFDYSYNMIPAYTWGSWEFLVSFLCCIGLAGYAIYGFKKRSVFGYAVFFFFISIFVVSNILFLIGNAFAERFMYLPSLAFCIALGYAVMSFYKDKGVLNFKGQPIYLFCLSGILILYSIKTIERNTDWKDNITLYSHDVVYADKSARIHYLLGYAYAYLEPLKGKSKKEMILKAENELRTTLNIFPGDETVKKYLIAIELENGEVAKAEKLMASDGIKNDTFSANLAYNLGVGLFNDKNYEAAIAKYKLALFANPALTKAYFNLGLTYENLQFYDSAITILNKGIDIGSREAKSYMILGLCYSQLKQYPKARENFNKALELNPNFADDIDFLSHIGVCCFEGK